ncbi:response regulator transcription factor [Pelosinus propionicus]|uniref:DNA-binding response regulator, OmpR family, contains REC and winged-helix (WHTH) domain n=1 Tax=Pelosinus propionicus DSM 13327 TaxID=1123291 RepID=A0A1I4K7V8_9FIRM|nr:response regulator transcription factor [Pelosinus propionicus]SFL74661.1 DNA-binding response regulator, OmpR family, contains REC and winged-helix (wHTH) domain [Pelosinus propionicus DSM 13327]
MNVLLAEDDVKLGKLIKHLLERNEIHVDWVVSGDMALESALYGSYDVIILDWMMPGQLGIAVCDQLRKRGYQGAVLMLTAKDALDDRVLGLDTGADDYFVKPFEFAELLARLRALARRSRVSLMENILQVGNIVLNGSTHCVQRGDTEIQLTSREFQLLDLLVRNQERIIPREVIFERIWRLKTEVSSNNLDAYVRLLRRKLSPFGDAIVIQTVRGVGYRLEVQNVCENS